MTRQGWWFLFGAVALAIAIYVIIWATLACYAPAWQAMFNNAPSCTEFWLNRYQGLIGALATLFAGFLAYRAAMSAAHRAERQARDARRAALTDQIERVCKDIDNLSVAASYIGTYVQRFPSEGNDELAYFREFQLARMTVSDAISYAALAAPDGFGPRINTLMTAIQQLGERTNEITSDQISTAKFFGAEIVNRIGGLRTVETQIRSAIPGFQARLITLRDELDTLAEN